VRPTGCLALPGSGRWSAVAGCLLARTVGGGRPWNGQQQVGNYSYTPAGPVAGTMQGPPRQLGVGNGRCCWGTQQPLATVRRTDHSGEIEKKTK